MARRVTHNPLADESDLSGQEDALQLRSRKRLRRGLSNATPMPNAIPIPPSVVPVVAAGEAPVVVREPLHRTRSASALLAASAPATIPPPPASTTTTTTTTSAPVAAAARPLMPTTTTTTSTASTAATVLAAVDVNALPPVVASQPQQEVRGFLSEEDRGFRPLPSQQPSTAATIQQIQPTRTARKRTMASTTTSATAAGAGAAAGTSATATAGVPIISADFAAASLSPDGIRALHAAADTSSATQVALLVVSIERSLPDPHTADLLLIDESSEAAAADPSQAEHRAQYTEAESKAVFDVLLTDATHVTKVVLHPRLNHMVFRGVLSVGSVIHVMRVLRRYDASVLASAPFLLLVDAAPALTNVNLDAETMQTMLGLPTVGHCPPLGCPLAAHRVFTLAPHTDDVAHISPQLASVPVETLESVPFRLDPTRHITLAAALGSSNPSSASSSSSSSSSASSLAVPIPSVLSAALATPAASSSSAPAATTSSTASGAAASTSSSTTTAPAPVPVPAATTTISNVQPQGFLLVRLVRRGNRHHFGKVGALDACPMNCTLHVVDASCTVGSTVISVPLVVWNAHRAVMSYASYDALQVGTLLLVAQYRVRRGHEISINARNPAGILIPIRDESVLPESLRSRVPPMELTNPYTFVHQGPSISHIPDAALVHLEGEIFHIAPQLPVLVMPMRHESRWALLSLSTFDYLVPVELTAYQFSDLQELRNLGVGDCVSLSNVRLSSIFCFVGPIGVEPRIVYGRTTYASTIRRVREATAASYRAIEQAWGAQKRAYVEGRVFPPLSVDASIDAFREVFMSPALSAASATSASAVGANASAGAAAAAAGNTGTSGVNSSTAVVGVKDLRGLRTSLGAPDRRLVVVQGRFLKRTARHVYLEDMNRTTDPSRVSSTEDIVRCRYEARSVQTRGRGQNAWVLSKSAGQEERVERRIEMVRGEVYAFGVWVGPEAEELWVTHVVEIQAQTDH